MLGDLNGDDPVGSSRSGLGREGMGVDVERMQTGPRRRATHQAAPVNRRSEVSLALDDTMKSTIRRRNSLKLQARPEESASDEEINEESKDEQSEDSDDDLLKAVTADGKIDHIAGMRSYVENYGISIDVPGFYIQDAKFYPNDPKYCV